jgi:hypothetical protein
VVRSGDDDLAAAGDAGRDRVGAVGDHRVLAITAHHHRRRPHLAEPREGGRIRLLQFADGKEGRHGGADLGGHCGVLARGRPRRQAQAHHSFPVTRCEPPAELAEVRVVPGPRIVLHSGRDQDQRRHAFGIGQRQPERGPAATAVADQDRGPDARLVEDGAQVGKPGKRGHGGRRAAEARIVVPDQPVTGG